MLLHTSTFNIALICVPLLINLAMLFHVMNKTLENDKNKYNTHTHILGPQETTHIYHLWLWFCYACLSLKSSHVPQFFANEFYTLGSHYLYIYCASLHVQITHSLPYMTCTCDQHRYVHDILKRRVVFCLFCVCFT